MPDVSEPLLIPSHNMRNVQKRDMALAIGIDASNIRAGGGITHLQQLLAAASPGRYMVGRVVVYGGEAVLASLPEKEWLQKIHVPLLDRSLPFRALWQQFVLPGILRRGDFDVLFAPGGTLPFRLPLPGVTMSQNMLPFESSEAARYGVGSLMWLKFKLLGRVQSRSMRRADGLIFLTEYAKRQVLEMIGPIHAAIATIPHGVEERFFQPPRDASLIDTYTWQSPFRLLYVSIVDVYKHQWQVARAVWLLRQKGLPVVADFVGPANPRALALLMKAKSELDALGEFVFYKGEVRFDSLHAAYHKADAFVFASSCENLPNILLEAMASGLPIASSERGPMPEVLGENGVYFDPEDAESIANALERMIVDADLRDRMAKGSVMRAKTFTWRQCADASLSFIVEVAKAKRKD